MHGINVKRQRNWVQAGLVCVASALTAVPAAATTYNLYVLEAAVPAVQVVQTDQNGVPKKNLGTPIPVGNIPAAAVATPNNQAVWVPNSGDGTITVINTSNNSTKKFSTVTSFDTYGVCTANSFQFPCSFPGTVAFSRDGSRAYLVDAGDYTLKIIDTSTGQVLKIISVGNFPTTVALTPNGNTAYVPNLVDNTVSVISIPQQKVVATVNIPIPNNIPPGGSLPSPTGAAVSLDGNFVYVTNAYDSTLIPPNDNPYQKSTVTVIRTSNNTVAETIDAGGFVASSVSFLLNAPIALVGNTGTDDYPDNKIGVISTSYPPTFLESLTEPSPAVGPAAIDPEGKLIYVVNIGTGSGGESILTLNATSLSNVNLFTLPAGSFPLSVAIIPAACP